jgi:SOS response regulatory protein OraA/RecX
MLSAYNRALEALARGPKSIKDLTRWLLQRDYPKEEVESTIERLITRNLLNDAAYAEMFARSRATTRGMSRRRISAELAKRGVARDLADAAINEVMSDENIDELAMVESAANKKFRSLAKLDPHVQRTRLYGFLARKGYAPDLVRQTVAKLTRVTALFVVLYVSAIATASAQQTPMRAPVGEADHRAVLELGFAGERGIGESSTALGGTNVGWYLEPSYSTTRVSDGSRSVGISAGLIIGIP